MVVIFVGAGLPSADTPLALLLLDGAVTGAVAGAVLGVVTGWHLASLTGPPAHNRVVLDLLASPWRGRLDRRVLGLEVRGRATGRRYRLPVQYAVDDDGLVVVPGRPERKTWWTNLTAPATPVAVLWGGDWVPGAAEVLRPGRPGYEHARTTYARRWRRTRLPAAQPVVRIRYAGPRIESRAGNP
nr:nitroreductase/quinone reductase family protein [Nocardioides panaciterrulae]